MGINVFYLFFKLPSSNSRCTVFTFTFPFSKAQLIEDFFVNRLGNGLINYIDTKAKCRHLKKFTRKGTLWQVLICVRPPPLL
jgi:hypothetical protein